MDSTLKNKAKFFALYLGSQLNYLFEEYDSSISCIHASISERRVSKLVSVWIYHEYELLVDTGHELYSVSDPENPYLLLRSVEDLNDEEVILCGQIGFDFFNCIGCEYKLKVIRELRTVSLAAVSIDEKTCLVKIEINNPWKLNIHQIDYLRSISICLPFTTIDENNQPVTYDPVEEKWAVIIKK